MGKKKVYRFPNNTTPNRVIVQDKNTYYTNKGEPNHGHSVRDSDGISYARTKRGRRLKK